MSRTRLRHPQADRLEGLLAPLPAGRPRIPPTPPRELRPLARAAAEIGGRLTGTGPPNLFTTLGRHPRLFRAWLCYSAHLMPFGRLPRRDTELVILRVAWRCGSVYEWRQHVPLALRAGLAPETIEAIAGHDSIDGFTHRQRTLLAISDDLLARRAMSDRTWEQVGAVLTDREIIEVCLLVGHYQGLASAIGGLAIEPEAGPSTRDAAAGASRSPPSADDGLDRLSSKELHDLSVSFAKRHRDARFFLRLSETLPAAEASAGEYERAAAEVIEPAAHVGDVTDSGSGATAEAMRPFYLDYLRRHGITAPVSPA